MRLNCFQRNANRFAVAKVNAKSSSAGVYCGNLNFAATVICEYTVFKLSRFVSVAREFECIGNVFMISAVE